jgi:hypothetical protein
VKVKVGDIIEVRVLGGAFVDGRVTCVLTKDDGEKYLIVAPLAAFVGTTTDYNEGDKPIPAPRLCPYALARIAIGEPVKVEEVK